MKKRLSTFVLMVSIIFCSNAQISITDIADTTLVPNQYDDPIEVFDFDLNNDGIMDFKFESKSPDQANIHTYNDNQVALSPPPFGGFYDYVKLFNENEVIDASSDWQSLAYGSYLYTTEMVSEWSGFFNNTEDVFVGLKLQVNNEVYYGWAQVDVGQYASFCTIKAYGYNTVANQPIACNLSTNINKLNEHQDYKIFPNPSNGNFKIEADKISHIKIYNIAGQLLYEDKTDSVKDKNLDLTHFKKGVYYISINSDEQWINKPIIIE